MDGTEAWPALPLEAWQETRDTLHMWTQILGKIRLKLTPHRIARAPRPDIGLRRLPELDGREPERVPDQPFPAQDGGGLPELRRRQRIQRVLHHNRHLVRPHQQCQPAQSR